MSASDLAVILPDARMGGAQRVLLRLAREFVASGRRVDVVLLVGDGELLDAIPAGASRFILFDRPPGRLRLALAGATRLRRLLRARGPRALLSSGSGTNLLATIATRGLRPRPRIALREAGSIASRSAPLRLLMRAIYPRADVCIGVSSGVAAELASLGIARARIATVPNPIDVEACVALAQQATIALPLGGAPYVVTVTRFDREKDVATLIRAFASIAAQVPHHLVIVGDGPDRSQVIAEIQRSGCAARIHLAGLLANPHPWLHAAALFALASRSEGYPNALLEALAHGLPVVATDCSPAVRDLLGGSGAVVPVGDAEAFADAMRRALQAPAGAPRPSVPAQQDPRAIAGRYLDLLGWR